MTYPPSLGRASAARSAIVHGTPPRPETARQNLRFAADAHPTLSTVLESVHQIELLSEDKASERHVVMTDTTSSFDVLQAYLLARASFSAEELAFMRTIFVPRSLVAGEFLQRAGDVARHAAFVARGCLRSFVIDAKGKEHVVQFAPEQWWLADAISLNSGTPSQYFFAAIEDSDLLLIDANGQQQIVDRVPGYSEAMRTGLQKHAAAKDLRIVKALSASAEERYLDFMHTFPMIAQRVPQWMLASYLGVSPETISRIRKQLARK